MCPLLPGSLTQVFTGGAAMEAHELVNGTWSSLRPGRSRLARLPLGRTLFLSSSSFTSNKSSHFWKDGTSLPPLSLLGPSLAVPSRLSPLCYLPSLSPLSTSSSCLPIPKFVFPRTHGEFCPLFMDEDGRKPSGQRLPASGGMGSRPRMGGPSLSQIPYSKC